MSGPKLYILDTNVLIHDPHAPFNFANVIVGIPIVVLEELDKFKSEMSDRGRSAREAARRLDGLRARGSLRDGVQLDHGGMIKILFLDAINLDQVSFLELTNDNQILMTAWQLKQQGQEVVFITKDINARVKADFLGLPAEDYQKGSVHEYDIYKGWRTHAVPAVQLKKDHPEELTELAQSTELLRNEYILLHSQNNLQNYRVFRYLGHGKFMPIFAPAFKWPFEPRNPQQLMALDLLMDDSIQLVSLIGPAGTGKSFLALLAGLDQVLIKEQYKKVLVSRPVVPLGADIGYLPGTIQEKLHSWMQPVYDNVDLIAHSVESSRHAGLTSEESYTERPGQLVSHGGHESHDYDYDYSDYESDYRKGSGLNKTPKKDKKARNGKHARVKQSKLRSLDEMINAGRISLEAITYMRGRSIPYQYIFIDEVQNLTLHEVKTLVSRVGVGSKIVLAGDPYQIDSPYLDFSSNGLVIASNKFKGQSIFGTVFLETSERSELSRLASELL